MWLARLRFVFATAVLCAALHYVVGWALPRGVDHPLVLSSSPYGPLAGVLLIAVVWGGAALASVMVQPAGRAQTLFIVGLALVLWAAEGGRRGGTMDDWLIRCNTVPGPPVGSPYWRLLPDYLYLLVAVAGASVASSRLARAAAVQPESVVRDLKSGATGLDYRRGLAVLATTAVIAGVATLVLMGPAVGATYRGQVYFAAGVGLFAGVFVGRRIGKDCDPAWFALGPFLLGVVGLLLAALWPGLMLPAEYRHINTIPAWNLARALPVEMVGIGLVGAMWVLRGSAAEAARAERE